VLALQRENKEVLWGSMVKETMKRKKPSFNETYYGFRTFSHLLEDAQRRGIVTLRRDQKSGSYIVEDLGAAANAPQAAIPGASGHAAPSAAVSPATPAAASASGVASGLAASSASPSEGESASGPRSGSRRRRGGRGRRRPGGPPLAPGAHPEASASGHAHDDAEGDFHDGDEEGDDFTSDEHESPETHAGAASPRPDAPPPPAAAHEAERGGFSLFGWMRRDSEGKKPD
jgi:hypothetical protein